MKHATRSPSPLTRLFTAAAAAALLSVAPACDGELEPRSADSNCDADVDKPVEETILRAIDPKALEASEQKREVVAEVPPGLDKDAIRRVVRSNISDIRGCYNSGLSRDPALAGRVSVQFSISPEGKVTEATAAESTDLEDEDVTRCVVVATSRWTFPSHEQSGDVRVTYPFVLSPG